MIDYFNGILASKDINTAVIETGGIGYSISITTDTSNKLSHIGSQVKLYIVESAGMYGGVISHYGFLSLQEREMFNLIKDQVPATGAKKAMEYMDKISKSLPDFQSAVVRKDTSLICSMFGFTKKTADKLVSALKDKIASVSVSGTQKWTAVASSSSNLTEAVAALMSLGYKETQAINTVNKIVSEQKDMSVEDIIKEALKYINK